MVSVHSNHELNKSLRSLLSKHINTGLGFEHLLFVLQNKLSNYNMDLFTPLSEKIQEVSGARPYQGHFGAQKMDVVDTMYHVVADHMRTSIFANSNDEVPNKGCSRKYLDAEIGSFFTKIVPTVSEQMGDIFPEIQKKEQGDVGRGRTSLCPQPSPWRGHVFRNMLRSASLRASHEIICGAYTTRMDSPPI